MLNQTIPSYLYLQYKDDEDLRAFVQMYNEMTQAYVTWFASASLPIYTAQSGDMLDWVANGLYGVMRPTLQGEPADDDVFKRCITWSFYKDDGKLFNIRWLKRRVQRWLNSVDGVAGDVNQTYQISVTFGAPNIVYINILPAIANITGGIEFNQAQFNQRQLNELELNIEHYSDTTLAATLRDAINSGILPLPFQYVYVVGISP